MPIYKFKMNAAKTHDFGMGILIIGATNLKNAIEKANEVSHYEGRVFEFRKVLKNAKFTGKKATVLSLDGYVE